jgi:hypothetical protein
VKTLVDEQEIQSSPAVSRKERKPQAAPSNIGSYKREMPTTSSVSAPPADCYESCLDLSAEFLARG